MAIAGKTVSKFYEILMQNRLACEWRANALQYCGIRLILRSKNRFGCWIKRSTKLIGRFYCRPFFIVASSEIDALKPAERRLFPLLSPPLSGGFGRSSGKKQAVRLPFSGSLAACFSFGRKNRRRSIEIFPAGFCWFCRFSDMRTNGSQIQD